jgi:hypothetical protein
MMALIMHTAVMALLAGSPATASTKLVPPTSSGGLYFSEHNWALMPRSGSSISEAGAEPVAISVNSGAYIKAAFSGSARASILLAATKPASQAGEASSTHYMNVVYSVDNKPWVEVP